MSNRLAQESSPYLQQHAGNPVDWYPWGPEALERAVSEDRPILLSVGYSSCHWCHVMERESFEDPTIAALMNKLYVNIKVDREERPDIDQIYMKAVQAMTGRGGWPMTVFLTPEGIPFFGGTYYPAEPQPGMPSLPQILESVADAWANRREDVLRGGEKLLDALRKTATSASESKVGSEVFQEAWRVLANRYDATYGGFGRAPKFPQPVTLEFLMVHHVRSGEPRALEMAVHTLRCMAAGGMRDHIGGGFHRYSVDSRWLVPHFEKMLYDNALLARAYLDAWRLTDSDDLREVVLDTLDYVSKDLTDSTGGFYSARDADSEGEEGTFYVWTLAEIDSILGPDAGLFNRIYGVTEGGNFEGRNIPHLVETVDDLALATGLPEGVLEEKIASCRAKLFEARQKREAPFRDEKIIASWNGLAIRAFAEAGAALGRADYVDVASRAAEHVWSHLRPDDRLLHSSMAGEAKGLAFLDDHASLGNALLSLHAATLELKWLDAAVWLANEVVTRFWDEESGTVFDTAADAEALILRPRDPMDNATPSGPSLAAELLARTGQIMGRSAWLDISRRIVDREADAMNQFGPAFGRMLVVGQRLSTAPAEIAIVGLKKDDGLDGGATDRLIRVAHSSLHANLVIAGTRGSGSGSGTPLLENREPVNGKPTAWVCSNYACRLPVNEALALTRELKMLLDPGQSSPK